MPDKHDPKLLTREAFKQAVLARDQNRCVCCSKGVDDGVKLDAHHIIDRQLFENGGYYLSNGATLCDDRDNGCHMKAEKTEITVHELYNLAAIKYPALADELVEGIEYDKWGNEILASGLRCRGPLFHTEPVQKILAPILGQFTEYVKHPRTWHLPWSPGATSDDKRIKNCEHFAGKHVTVTRKMDGESFTGYQNYSHARSIDGRHHPSRDYAKQFWAERSFDLPDGWRVCCENVYAVHSLRYNNLPDWMIGLFIWNDKNVCLSVEDTQEWMELLRIPMAEVIYSGIWDEDAIRKLHIPDRDDATHEGYVVRTSEPFHNSQFKSSIAKYVRTGHVTSDQHWMHGKIETNGLITNKK